MSAWVTVAPMVGLDTAGLEKTKKLLDTQLLQPKVAAKMHIFLEFFPQHYDADLAGLQPVGLVPAIWLAFKKALY